MRILILAVELTPYFNFHYKALQEAGHDLMIFHFDNDLNTKPDDSEVKSSGIQYFNVHGTSGLKIILMAKKYAPDIIVCPGWNKLVFTLVCLFVRAVRIVISDAKYNPISVRQRIMQKTKIVSVKPFFDYAFVPGSPQKKLMLRLGFEDEDIFLGLLSYLQTDLPIVPIAQAERSLLYIGRLTPEKGILRLLQGYREYRKLSTNPFKLIIAGKGIPEITKIISETKGVECHGYVQNSRISELIDRSKALVLFSHSEYSVG